MKRIIFAALLLLAAGFSYADQGGEGNNAHCNGQGNINSPCVPGSGSASSSFQDQYQEQSQTATGGYSAAYAAAYPTANGGSGGSVQYSGNSSNANTVTGTNSNDNRSTASNQNSGNNTGTANVVVQGDAAQARNPVSTASAPVVVTGSDQCLVAAAVGAQGIGFGISFGTATRDEICEALKLTRQLMSMGFPDQALKLLKAADPRVAAAFE